MPNNINKQGMNIYDFFKDQKIFLVLLNTIFAYLTTHIQTFLAIVATFITVCVSFYTLLKVRSEYRVKRAEEKFRIAEIEQMIKNLNDGKAEEKT